MVFLQRTQKSACESEVSFHEFVVVFWAVYASKVEDEVALAAPSVQLLRRGIDVILEYVVDFEVTIATRLAVFYVVQLSTEVLAYEPFCACHKDFHYFARFSIPFNSFWIYSRDAIFSLVSSRFRRRVLSELNSVIVTCLVSPSLKNLS